MTALEIRNLCKRYGARTVVQDLSLQVEPGSIFGLLGPNGSGKTTTLACTLGLLRATSGTTRVLGESAANIHKLKGRLSVVFDTAIALSSLSATQNLEYIRTLIGHSRGRSNAEVLEAVGMSEMARAKVSSLSLGQSKRLAIAGALLGEPDLLVLDEPLSGLDTMSVRTMLRLFESLRAGGMTLVLSSHRLHEMQTVVTHVGILHGGRIVKGGTLDEVLGRGLGVYVLKTDRGAQAKDLIARTDGFECLAFDEVSKAGAAPFAKLEVRADARPISELNRVLVEQGVAVHAIEERVDSLQSVFERIVDAGGAKGAVA